MAKRAAPEVNAGSMADIAFLLLIFFLVTTTIEVDSGISRLLPPIQPPNEKPEIIKDKNIFQVIVNKNDQLLVEDQLMELKDLKAATVKFVDNGGGVGEDACSYCQGLRDPASSDNPSKAVVSLQNDRETSYKMYISVQNELVAAYTELRNAYAERTYGKSYVDMLDEFDRIYQGNNDKLKEKIEDIKKKYPQLISEATTKN